MLSKCKGGVQWNTTNYQFRFFLQFFFLYFTRYHPIWRSYLEWWLLLWSHTISDHISNYQSLKGCSMHNKWYWWLMAELLINIEREKKQWHSLKWVSWVKKTLSLPSKVTQDPRLCGRGHGEGLTQHFVAVKWRCLMHLLQTDPFNFLYSDNAASFFSSLF